MLIVAVDIGNNATKLGIFSSQKPPTAPEPQFAAPSLDIPAANNSGPLISPSRSVQPDVASVVDYKSPAPSFPSLVWSHSIAQQRPFEWKEWVLAGIENSLPISGIEGEKWEGKSLVRWSICSVNPIRADQLIKFLKKNRPLDQIQLIKPEHVPLKSRVDDIIRLGRDRLVAAWHAFQITGGKAVVVIDAGTAVTIDHVDSQGMHWGGLIFPGTDLMFESLHRHTAALPDLRKDHRFGNQSIEQLGTNTEQAIWQGVIRSQISTIKFTVESISKLTSPVPWVFLTGGGGLQLQQYLPPDYLYIPDLVLSGADALGRID